MCTRLGKGISCSSALSSEILGTYALRMTDHVPRNAVEAVIQGSLSECQISDVTRDPKNAWISSPKDSKIHS